MPATYGRRGQRRSTSTGSRQPSSGSNGSATSPRSTQSVAALRRELQRDAVAPSSPPPEKKAAEASSSPRRSPRSGTVSRVALAAASTTSVVAAAAKAGAAPDEARAVTDPAGCGSDDEDSVVVASPASSTKSPGRSRTVGADSGAAHSPSRSRRNRAQAATKPAKPSRQKNDGGPSPKRARSRSPSRRNAAVPVPAPVPMPVPLAAASPAKSPVAINPSAARALLARKTAGPAATSAGKSGSASASPPPPSEGRSPQAPRGSPLRLANAARPVVSGLVRPRVLDTALAGHPPPRQQATRPSVHASFFRPRSLQQKPLAAAIPEKSTAAAALEKHVTPASSVPKKPAAAAAAAVLEKPAKLRPAPALALGRLVKGSEGSRPTPAQPPTASAASAVEAGISPRKLPSPALRSASASPARSARGSPRRANAPAARRATSSAVSSAESLQSDAGRAAHESGAGTPPLPEDASLLPSAAIMIQLEDVARSARASLAAGRQAQLDDELREVWGELRGVQSSDCAAMTLALARLAVRCLNSEFRCYLRAHNVLPRLGAFVSRAVCAPGRLAPIHLAAAAFFSALASDSLAPLLAKSPAVFDALRRILDAPGRTCLPPIDDPAAASSGDTKAKGTEPKRPRGLSLFSKAGKPAAVAVTSPALVNDGLGESVKLVRRHLCQALAPAAERLDMPAKDLPAQLLVMDALASVMSSDAFTMLQEHLQSSKILQSLGQQLNRDVSMVVQRGLHRGLRATTDDTDLLLATLHLPRALAIMQRALFLNADAQLQIVGQDGQRLLDDLAMLVYFYHKLATDATEGQGMLEDAATCCCGALQLLMALSNNNDDVCRKLGTKRLMHDLASIVFGAQDQPLDGNAHNVIVLVLPLLCNLVESNAYNRVRLASLLLDDNATTENSSSAVDSPTDSARSRSAPASSAQALAPNSVMRAAVRLCLKMAKQAEEAMCTTEAEVNDNLVGSYSAVLLGCLCHNDDILTEVLLDEASERGLELIMIHLAKFLRFHHSMGTGNRQDAEAIANVFGFFQRIKDGTHNATPLFG